VPVSFHHPENQKHFSVHGIKSYCLTDSPCSFRKYRMSNSVSGVGRIVFSLKHLWLADIQQKTSDGIKKSFIALTSGRKVQT
jgi:hypothetical protein